MNFIAKHFFEYQSFVNMPHKAVQLHKVPPSQAGNDPSVGWAPKNMNKAGKNQPSPSARANRVHRDPRPNGTRHGRAGKHEHRDWGDRHGDLNDFESILIVMVEIEAKEDEQMKCKESFCNEQNKDSEFRCVNAHIQLKDEKVAPHKDAWTKFLSNEDPGQRTVFECDFEDRVLATGEETLPERIARIGSDGLESQIYSANKCSMDNDCELLTILTYAPTVQFVTATVKRAKALPYNNC
uniref:Uncharacterized protein n=1 Tax=Heterorhabditis bacteriophora TaxID=37862 RepID=A0A1I7XUA0_HETBA